MTMTLIATQAFSGVNTVDFASIPATYTDLKLVISARSTRVTDSAIGITFNTSGGTYANRRLYGNGSTVGSDTQSAGGLAYANIPGAGSTSNTFGSIDVYIPNYAGSTVKSFSSDVVEENNSASTYVQLMLFASSWSGTAAISTITLYDWNGSNFATGTTASLYGILKGSGGATVS